MSGLTVERPICGAKTSAGHPCGRSPMSNGRCDMHGGKSLKGIASPSLKAGKYSEYLPKRFHEVYQQSITDPDILATRYEIAVIDARIADVLSQADTGQSGEAWKTVKSLLKEYKAEQTPERLADLEYAVNVGVNEYFAWHEIMELMETRRKLSETEQKRLRSMGAMIDADKAMTMVASLLGAVKANVTDRAALQAIQSEFERLIGANDK